MTGRSASSLAGVTRRLTVLLGMILALAACGDDGADTTTSAPTTTEPPATTTTLGGTTTPAPDTTATLPTTPTTVPPPPPLGEVGIALVPVAAGLSNPVLVTARTGDDRLFVVEQPGVVLALTPGGDRETILDLRSRVEYGGEQGLLGLAFHPTDPDRTFLHYSAAGSGDTVLEEFDLTTGESVGVVLTVAQPAGNHNGGMIAFGPDGMLYVGLGDGGGANDQYRHGQNRDSLLGAILRIDVDSAFPYAIPADNPFATDGGAPEVWAYGLRNPWRFSFDGDDLWIGDVGQGEWEEVSMVSIDQGGHNLGWSVYEGTHCFGAAALCVPDGFTMPVFEYSHDGGRCSITGGYVYRGSAVPGLAGAYLFGDWCTGEVMGLRIGDGDAVEHRIFPVDAPRITSFGVGPDGEVYLTAGDSVFLIVAG